MQRIDILGLQAFVCVSEEGSFRGAANRLNLSPTAVTRRLQKLEDSLGVVLISRTTRKVTLTKPGTAFLRQAQVTLATMEASLEALRLQGRFGDDSISFACLPTVTSLHLPPVLRRYAESSATMVRVVDLSATEILEQVRNNEVDFGITIVGADYHDLCSKPLFSEPIVALVQASQPLASKSSLTWSQIANERLISIGARSGIRRIIDTSMSAYDIDLTWKYEVQHLASAVSLAAEGVGVAILPACAKKMVRSNELVAVELTDPTVQRNIGLIWRNDLPMRAASKKLCRLIETMIR